MTYSPYVMLVVNFFNFGLVSLGVLELLLLLFPCTKNFQKRHRHVLPTYYKILKLFPSLKWCIKGECVDDGSPMIDGGWSDWQDTQSCTQTCGGGVQWKTRSCTNPV